MTVGCFASIHHYYNCDKVAIVPLDYSNSIHSRHSLAAPFGLLVLPRLRSRAFAAVAAACGS